MRAGSKAGVVAGEAWDKTTSAGKSNKVVTRRHRAQIPFVTPMDALAKAGHLAQRLVRLAHFERELNAKDTLGRSVIVYGARTRARASNRNHA